LNRGRNAKNSRSSIKSNGMGGVQLNRNNWNRKRQAKGMNQLKIKIRIPYETKGKDGKKGKRRRIRGSGTRRQGEGTPQG